MKKKATDECIFKISVYLLSTIMNVSKPLHESCLRIINNNSPSSFTNLQKIHRSVSVRHRNIQVLVQIFNSLSPELVNDCFKQNSMTVFNTINRSTLYSRPVRTVLHGAESFFHLGLEIWEIAPNDIINISTLTAFKKIIKK